MRLVASCEVCGCLMQLESLYSADRSQSFDVRELQNEMDESKS